MNFVPEMDTMSSQHYIWTSRDFLGQGATAKVFKGRHKVTGESVAVKMLTRCSADEKKEADILGRLKHENIISLITVEDEATSRNKVIVMELCEGGCLRKILDEAKNLRGFEESEFLAVLRDIAGGMKYLREQNFVHRDIKPANIMKFIKDDGSPLYKLTDFGTARELMDEDTFMSLYGTEEYLHPAMYSRYRFRETTKSFTAAVDLWSVGITLYHIATGQLPFKPFMGRQDPFTMLKMTAEKNSGDIAGLQEKQNGPIVYTNKLPSACTLSKSLQDFIVPILAGVLEKEDELCWSFDKFFQSVDSILNKVVLYVYDFLTFTFQRIYLDPTDNYADLISKIDQYFGTESTNLLFNGKLLASEVLRDQNVSAYPATSLSNPIIIIPNNIFESKQMPALPSLEKRQVPSFSTNSSPPASTILVGGLPTNNPNYIVDFKTIKMHVYEMYFIRNSIQDCILASALTRDVLRTYIQLYLDEFNAAVKALEYHSDIFESVLQKFNSLQTVHNSEQKICQLTFPAMFDISDLDEIKQKAENLVSDRRDIQDVIKQLKADTTLAVDSFRKTSIKDWTSSQSFNTFPWKLEENKSLEICDNYIQQTLPLVSAFHTKAKRRSPSTTTTTPPAPTAASIQHDILVHQLDCTWVQKRYRDCASLLFDKCSQKLAQTQHDAVQWLSELEERYEALYRLNSTVQQFADAISQFSTDIDAEIDVYTGLSAQLWDLFGVQLGELEQPSVNSLNGKERRQLKNKNDKTIKISSSKLRQIMRTDEELQLHESPSEMVNSMETKIQQMHAQMEANSLETQRFLDEQNTSSSSSHQNHNQ